MSNVRWTALVVGIVSLTALLLSGCGVSRASYSALETELNEMKEICPPADFSSLSELEDWLSANEVSEEPITEYADDWYRKALTIQEDALEDGYIISADYDLSEDGESASVWCVAIVRGRVFFWDPETDYVTEEFFFGTVK
jgi:hypothetical protein